MPTFDETKQKAKLESLQAREEEDLAQILSQKYGIGYADLSREAISTDGLQLLSEKQARECEVAVFQKLAKKITLAVRTPNNEHLKKILADLKERGYDAELKLVSRHSLERAWDHYKDITLSTETEAGMLDISSEQIKEITKNVQSLGDTRQALVDLQKMKRLYRITRMLETIIASALTNHASDIHIEPEKDTIRIRYRLDGVLLDMHNFDHETYRLLLSRVKLLSGLKINLEHTAQDGRFSVRIDDKEIEIRTSVLPGNYGESIVMRILDPAAISIPFEDLGMSKKVRESLGAQLQKPNGMILNTGPTGSGKTTTLYAFLKKVHNPDIKIITIEDPIEYHLAGIVQTQVESGKYSFADGLHSALRQDPDVIMVGEIRDNEVATTAINAALTGHLVFSTLHTNTAAGAIPRLVELGIQKEILGSSINAVMAQRLIRVIDDRYKKQIPLEGAQREMVERVLDKIADRDLIPKNIDHIWTVDPPEHETGYKGRIAVYEVIEMTREMEQAARGNMTIRELEDAARPQGMPFLYEDAILKVLEGVTTLEEVHRVLGDPDLE